MLINKPQEGPTTDPTEGPLGSLQWSPAFGGVITTDLDASKLMLVISSDAASLGSIL